MVELVLGEMVGKQVFVCFGVSVIFDILINISKQ